MKRAIILVAGLVSANFAHQYFHGQNWVLAFDRSYFQAWAVAIYVFCNRRRGADFIIKGDDLTKTALIYGVTRRWHGLEPDCLFRPRLVAYIKGAEQ